MAGDLVQIPVSIGSRRCVMTAVELSVVVGFLLLPALTVPWVVTLGSLACEILRRRIWYKMLVNVANQTTPVCVAAVAFSWLHPGPATASAPAWLALIVATLVFSLLNALCASTVIATATQSRVWPAIKRALPAQAVNCVGNLLLALVGLILWVVPRAGVVVVPVAAVAAWWEYRRLLRTRTERDGLALLDRASRPIAALDPLAAFTEVADRAGDLLGADEVQVRVLAWPPHDAAWCFRRRRGTADAWEQTVADADAEQPALAVPLVSGSAVLGSLELRIDHALSVQERHVLNAFAATVASAVDHARGFAAATHAASHDPLTGLSNRPGLAARITEALAGRPPLVIEGGGRRTPIDGDGLAALLLLDLDHFKEVNDTLGHEAGDRLLVEVGRRLQGCLREHDVVARLGGDEFAILLRGLHDAEAAVTSGLSLLQRLTEPVELDGLRLPLEGSVGVAVAGQDADDVDGLLRCADIAMYEAKRRRNTVVRYQPSQDTSSPERLALIGELQTGIRRGELVLHYQPKIDLRTARMAGAEALVRWQHPTRGLLYPGDFIDAVERTGLVVELTLEVLDIAVREAVEWQRLRRAGDTPVTVAVNISRRCLVHREFPQEVVAVLLRHGLPGRALTLEITETMELAELEVVEDVLTRLRELGVHLSVDDFGTGYSSMSFFQRVQVDEVKIDGSFVQAMHRSSSARAIVRSTLELGHGVGLPVVAEGVETADQLAELIAAGCDSGQGYYLGRPMPGPMLHELLGRPHPHVLAELEGRPVDRAVEHAAACD